MAMFRRSGSVACFFYEGELPRPGEEAFQQALLEHRFRTIENAASEETSIGWVTPDDPTGDQFTPESMDADHGIWLRFRIDRKKLPQAWVAIHRATAERAAGRKLSAKEKKELKEDLMETLLPRVLPTVTLIDAVCFPERNLVQLFASSNSAKEAFAKLFAETFNLLFEEGGPQQWALATGLDHDGVDALARTSAVPWPRGKSTGEPEIRRPQPARESEPEPEFDEEDAPFETEETVS